MIKTFENFGKKIEVSIRVEDEFFGEFEVKESNIRNLAKKLGIKYVGGDGFTDYYLFEVDENNVDKVIEKLKALPYIEYAGVFDENLRKVWTISQSIKDHLESLEDVAEHIEFDKSLWDKRISKLEKLIGELKNIY